MAGTIPGMITSMTTEDRVVEATVTEDCLTGTSGMQSISSMRVGRRSLEAHQGLFDRKEKEKRSLTPSIFILEG